MPDLMFPIHHRNGNLPAVIFTPYKYRFPLPNLIDLQSADKIPSTYNRVRLYLPGDFNENINASWGPQDILTGMSNTVLGGALANVSSLFGSKENRLIGQIQVNSGTIPFPTDVNIFQGVEPITLQFSFNMIPYDNAEGDEIVNIIKNFKKAILPKSATGIKATLLEFPDTWDIECVNINGLGVEIDQFYENMALTNCSVQYVSGTENASVYNDKNPTQVKLNLSFQSMRKQFLVQ